LDTVLEAAQTLAKSNPEICFAFFGDGPEKGRLQASAKERDLKNVCFFSPQPAAVMPAILSALDIAVVPLKNLPLFRDVLPAKLFECMAAKLPIVLAVDGEARCLLEQANGGIYVQPEDPATLADAIRKLSDDPSLRRELGENGSRYVFAHYDRTEIAQRFANLLPTKVTEPVLSTINKAPVRAQSRIDSL
jgi:glycosyltransferase involved in cell wall biosynthesis